MNIIILHIPKTGGTTLIMNLLKCNKPPKPNTYYRHINNIFTGGNNCKELIDNYENYKNNTIISFMRDPLERLFSEFCFLRNRKQFIVMFNNFPEKFEEYILSPKTHNQMCKFILGIDLYSDKYVINDNNYDKIIDFFENSNIIYCLTEEYNKSLIAIEKILDINLKKQILNYRENLNKLEKNNWEYIETIFKKHNYYDIKLFDFFKNKFELQNNKINIEKENYNFNFLENKYHSLMLYCNLPANRCPLNIFNPNSDFVEKNKEKLKNLNKISRKNIKSISAAGIEFGINWLKLFIHIYKLDININMSNPLETIKEISSLKKFS